MDVPHPPQMPSSLASYIQNSIVEGAPSCHKAHAFQFIVLLPFHPAILEPDFDLSFRETQRVGYLYPPPSGKVPIEVKLFLQLQRLIPGVGLPSAFAVRVCCERR